MFGSASKTEQSFGHTFWTEHCLLVSNAPQPVAAPPGNGLELREDELFHLSLLIGRLWGRDNFWYLAFLPRYPSLARDPLFRRLGTPFDQLPIDHSDGGLFTLRPSVSDAWLQIQNCMVATYDILRAKFLPMVPLQTRMPPLPQSTNFHGSHSTEVAARRAAHRTRRIFLAWLCLISCAIAASNRLPPTEPPAWFRALAEADVPFPPFWLDKVSQSPILSKFAPDYPRQGMVVNMSREWGFWSLIDVLHQGSIPMWLCFPHGAVVTYQLARELYPSRGSIARAKESYTQGGGDADDGDNMWTRELLPYHPSLGNGSDPLPSASISSQPATLQFAENDPPGSDPTRCDAISNFFRMRKVTNDRRDLTMYSARQLDVMRARGKVLQSTSKVYEWDTIDVFPWFVREKVPSWDQRRVWELYTANQRVYDEFLDEWDCFAEFAPAENIDCGVIGCRDPTHDHDEDPLDADHVDAGHALVRAWAGYEEGEADGEAECVRLAFNRERMDCFMDVLIFRYGMQVGAVAGTDTEDGQVTPPLLEALRAMVQEEALNMPGWRRPEIVGAIIQFYACIKARGRVPGHISDCHLAGEDFQRQYNAWNFTITSFTLSGSSGSSTKVHAIGTVNSRVLTWSVAVEGQLALREILRRRWGPANAQIVRGLLERGMAFHVLWHAPPPMSMTSSSLYEIPFRREGYMFTPDDYKAYVDRRIELFKTPAVASAALRHGGIVWRLAMESSVDVDKVVSAAENDNAFCCRTASSGTTMLMTHGLSAEVLDAIVGVYKVYTGKGSQTADVSWWPKAHTWSTTGMNCGHWTFQCEEWFRRRRDAILDGTVRPRKPKEWHSSLRLQMSATRGLLRVMDSEYRAADAL